MTIEEQLEKLREEYREAKRLGNTSKMQTIALKGKCLKLKAKPDPFSEIIDIFK
jgi:hypothetical protein